MTDTQKTGAEHLNGESFNKTINNPEGLPVFVDFYAEWCGPCKMAAPIIDKLSVEYAGKVIITKLDVDAENALAGQYGVMSIPTVLMFKDGKEVDRKIGFGGEAGYRQMLDKVAPAA
jgi:thioredoxin 1